MPSIINNRTQVQRAVRVHELQGQDSPMHVAAQMDVQMVRLL